MFGIVTTDSKTNDPVGFQWEQIISAPLNTTPKTFCEQKVGYRINFTLKHKISTQENSPVTSSAQEPNKTWIINST